MKARYFKHHLKFKQASGTSRGILTIKETWFILLSEGNKVGVGECGILRGLSCDDRPDYEAKLDWACRHIHLDKSVLLKELIEFPSIQMGIEMALLSLKSKAPFQLFENDFSNSQAQIPINGLIWMGNKEFMMNQVAEKLAQGYTCIKMKVGAIDFDQELDILSSIRKHYDKDKVVLRVDANGAFGNDALEKLTQLAAFDLHSIEQPIPKGNINALRELCKYSPLPIALDEELIGVFTVQQKTQLLEQIMPQYIILKPSFIGGFQGAAQWASLAEKYGIGSWVTSALESNIGLNAIAQWCYEMNFKSHQGLGTGSLFSNNIPSPLVIKNGYLSIDKNLVWPSTREMFS